MYHHQTVVMVSPFKESSFESPLLFKTKKYAIVAISVLTLAVWLFVRPTEVVLLVMDMHWQYARRYRAFLVRAFSVSCLVKVEIEIRGIDNKEESDREVHR
mgnify:CR=1 FL=1